MTGISGVGSKSEGSLPALIHAQENMVKSAEEAVAAAAKHAREAPTIEFHPSVFSSSAQPSFLPTLSPIKRKRGRRRIKRAIPAPPDEHYSDQLGVKLSWSAWMNKREDDKFHVETIMRAKSYVGKQINEHVDKLNKLNQIFDPQKAKDLQRAFVAQKVARYSSFASQWQRYGRRKRW